MKAIGISVARWPARIGFLALTCMTLAASCDQKREEPATITRLTADGKVIIDSTAPHQGLKYSLDGEKYGKWVVAQQALDAIPDLTIPSRVSLAQFTEDDVDDAADWLEKNERARTAFKSADISAKDYVRTSVALEQLVATMRTSQPMRFRDVPPGNAEFISRQTGFRQTFDARRVRVVGDADSDDRDSDGDSDVRGAGTRRDVDSDAGDSDGKKKAKGAKKNGKGKGGDGR